jgi:hypothetical protein
MEFTLFLNISYTSNLKLASIIRPSPHPKKLEEEKCPEHDVINTRKSCASGTTMESE